jgi:hypothetical protein
MGRDGSSAGQPSRVSVGEMKAKLDAKSGALLVCIYGEESWRESHLEGSISMDEFARRAGVISREVEVVFY